MVLAGAGVVVAAAIVWLSAGLSSLLSGHGIHDVEPKAAIGILFRVLAHPGAPARAFPIRLRRDIADAQGFWLIVAGVLVIAASSWVAVKRASRWARLENPGRNPRGGWAQSSDLAPLLVQKPARGRLVVGRSGRSLVATEPGHSLLVVGPTQSGKTTGLAIPAILEWDGPVVATSVKTDLVASTATGRSRKGAVAIFDPLGVSGSAPASWSPLSAAGSFLGACRVAASLCSVQRDAGRSPDDAAFWGSLAEKLLAPMLFAAASEQKSMRDVVAWVDTGEVTEVLDVLARAGDEDALRWARASFGREERQLASVYATTEAAISAFGDPLVEARGAVPIDVRSLCAGATDTCYLVAPAHEQERLRPVFVALLREILEEAFTAAAASGRLDPPLLVVLDEAANIAPVSNLDSLASTASSHGIQLVTVWQDFAQITARYKERAATVVNNHRARLVFPGVSDPDTLDQFSKLIGDDSVETESVTTDAQGLVSSTRSEQDRRLVSAAELRTLESGEAILLYGRLPPLRVTLRRPGGAPRREGPARRLAAFVRRGAEKARDHP